jgi:hypothetical protein
LKSGASRKGDRSYAGEPDAPGFDVEVLEIVNEAGGKVVGDAVDEDLVSQWLLAKFRDQLFVSLCFLP